MFGREGEESAIMTLEESAFERTSPGDAVAQDFANEPAQMGPGADGIPEFQAMGQYHVAPLDPDTFVCMADTRAFVLRDRQSRIVMQFEARLVEREADGRWWVDAGRVDLLLDERQSYATDWERLRRIWDELVRPGAVAADRELTGRLARVGVEAVVVERRVEVFPIRPKCEHYFRYLTDLPQSLEEQVVQRICTAQRDENGFLLSVRDQRMQACELRVPRHAPTERQLDDFDAEKIRLGRERREEQAAEFDVDQALADEE